MPQKIGETIPASEFGKLKVPKVGDTISAEEFSRMQGGTSTTRPRTPAHGFGGSGTYTRDMSPGQLDNELTLQRLESLGVDPSSPIFGTGKNILTGLGQLISPFMTNTPTLMAKPEIMQRSVDTAKSAVTTTARAPYDMIEGNVSGLTNDPYNEGEGFQRANRGAAVTAALVAPRAAGAVQSVSKGLSNATTLPRTAATSASNRIASSLVKPREISFQFGHDPLEAAAQVRPAFTLNAYEKNIQQLVNRQESLLQRAIAKRKYEMTRANKPNGIDVEPGVRSAFEDMIAAAEMDGKQSVANTLRSVMDKRIKAIVNEYGSTYLDGEQILKLKRQLSREVKFRDLDVEQVTLNEAKSNMYRALDKSLDTLVPEAAQINRQYGNMIQLRNLIADQIIKRGNQNLVVRGSFLETVAGMLPEVALKTGATRALNIGRNFEGTSLGGTTPMYETFKPPTPDPYGVSNKLFNKP